MGPGFHVSSRLYGRRDGGERNGVRMGVNQNDFLDVFVLAERLHRQFLESIQLELDLMNIRDINNVRALMLMNIGDAEMTVGELLWRGCYLGSNVSYNLKKLTDAGYVIQERSSHDKRVIMVRSSQKGADLCAMLQGMNARHISALDRSDFKVEDLSSCRQMLRTLQRSWSQGGGAGPAGDAGYAPEHDSHSRDAALPRDRASDRGAGGGFARSAVAAASLGPSRD
jgi:DNA-binding MarR family transcriptional regulator